MTTNTHPHHARIIDNIRGIVRSGHGALVTFEGSPDTVLELAGPKGMHPGGDLCAAPVPTIRLWATWGGAPLAVAAANQNFTVALGTVAERARPLVGNEHRALLALLLAVREATDGMRFRVPVVGEVVTEEGDPSPAAWSSCLPLGALQAAIQRATRIRVAA
jgi:hypothetical protein